MSKIIELGYNLITPLLDEEDFDPNARTNISIPGSDRDFDALIIQQTELLRAKVSYEERLIYNHYTEEEAKERSNDRFGERLNRICKEIDRLSSIPLLHLAIARRQVKLPISRVDDAGNLIHYTHSESPTLVSRLLEYPGINIHALGPYHETALHRAVEAMDIATAQVLTDRGIDCSISNKYDQTAYDKALDLYKAITRNPHLARDKAEAKLNLIHQLMTLTAPPRVSVPTRTELDLSLASSAASAAVAAGAGAAAASSAKVPGKTAKVFPAQAGLFKGARRAAAGAGGCAAGMDGDYSIHEEPGKEIVAYTDLKAKALAAIVDYKRHNKTRYGSRRAQALIDALNDSTRKVDVVGILGDFLASGIVSSYESHISAFFSGVCPSSATTEGSLRYTLKEALSITAIDKTTIKEQLVAKHPEPVRAAGLSAH